MRKSAPTGTLHVDGNLSAQGGTINVNGETIALPPFNPYATGYSP